MTYDKIPLTPSYDFGRTYVADKCAASSSDASTPSDNILSISTYFHEARLAIEIDGGQHGQDNHYDEKRTAYIEAQGVRVLRFWNNQVLAETEGVLEMIRLFLVAQGRSAFS